MKKRARIVHLLLIALMASAISCNSAQPPSDDTASSPVTDDSDTGTTAYIDTLPTADYSGKTFRVIGQDTTERQNFYTVEKEGDVINDAIHTRDLLVSERLGVEFEYISTESGGEAASAIIQTVLADDPAYDMVITILSDGINTMIGSDVLYDMNEIPHLTLEGGLWDASIHRNMSFAGRQYFSTGVISPQFCQSPVACLFNKRLAAEQQLGDLYDVVLGGKWTVDFMHSIIRDAARDLNGSNSMDVEDFYGFALDRVFGSVLYAASGFNPISVEDGVYTVHLAAEPILNLIEKCARIFGDPETVWHNSRSDGSSLRVFRESRSIFTTCDMLSIQTFREMTDDFGILPTPKLEETQESYITSCTTWLPTGVAVPKNIQDAGMVGLVMETMAVYSRDHILPAVYDITLQGKVARDDKSEQMLDIIFENPAYDFITTFDFGGSGSKLRTQILGWDENWVSAWDSMKAGVEAEINALMQTEE